MFIIFYVIFWMLVFAVRATWMLLRGIFWLILWCCMSSRRIR